MVFAGKHLWRRWQLINRAFICFLLLTLSLSTAERCHANENSAHTGLDTGNASLEAIADGFEQRVRQAFEAERGKPLIRAEKRPPLGPNRGNYVRAYSWSIVDFATRSFILNEQTSEANAALRENARHYLNNPKDVTDHDSFHWHSEMLCRLIEQYGAHGKIMPRRMSAETEEILMEQLWSYASQCVPIAEAEIEKSQTWHIYDSENHHAQHFTTAWHFAKLAKNHPGFQNRIYPDCSTPAQQYGAWTAYIKAYCTERAKKGLFIECGSDAYNVVLMKGIYNVFDFSDNPLLKQRAEYLLNLCWATWAQEQIDGVRGGGRARIYQNGLNDRMGNSDMRSLAWFFFGIGQPQRPVSPLLSALTTTWRPPLVVIDLALDVDGRGHYEVSNPIMGLLKEKWDPASMRNVLDPEGGSITRYSWCTPGFILGTLFVEPRPPEDWVGFSSQNRWHGVIFAGDPNARIIPQLEGMGNKKTYNAHWAAQRKGSLICQKLKTSKASADMRVWFSEAGLSSPTLENGWYFVEAPKAYAAVRVVTGDAALEPGKQGYFEPRGLWLRCKERYTPVILEVACKEDFENYAAFRKAVAALPMSFKNNVLQYQGLSKDKFSFYADQTKTPEVNGLPISYSLQKAFDSPFINGDWKGGVITISKDYRQLVLDFNKGL